MPLPLVTFENWRDDGSPVCYRSASASRMESCCINKCPGLKCKLDDGISNWEEKFSDPASRHKAIGRQQLLKT